MTILLIYAKKKKKKQHKTKQKAQNMKGNFLRM